MLCVLKFEITCFQTNKRTNSTANMNEWVLDVTYYSWVRFVRLLKLKHKHKLHKMILVCVFDYVLVTWMPQYMFDDDMYLLCLRIASIDDSQTYPLLYVSMDTS